MCVCVCVCACVRCFASSVSTTRTLGTRIARFARIAGNGMILFLF